MDAHCGDVGILLTDVPLSRACSSKGSNRLELWAVLWPSKHVDIPGMSCAAELDFSICQSPSFCCSFSYTQYERKRHVIVDFSSVQPPKVILLVLTVPGSVLIQTLSQSHCAAVLSRSYC